ncbi:hypothetical protein C6P46_004681 [Rhodotorula mucilaginosa]|uniref:Uncharacterized protein n=1 Tax=Rhodotorula mucilaginosa TaxID=5537 RepID=A0A9P6W0D8_RHOMI|nr:hypothetical protein C6P46_004681 [Rhodotorula mucilaginosa]
MRCKLPLELELTILELAAPPLAIDRLHDRVDFFTKISLVHRSLTAWARDRLHDQFLYTYQPRPDEHERLKRRLEAGFGRDQANDLMSVIETLPSTIRRVHILLHEIHVHNSRVDLPHLEFFTFTWLQRSAENGPQTSADDNLDALEDLRRAVNSIVNAPQCTFKYLRSTESPEDALADALAALKMDL